MTHPEENREKLVDLAYRRSSDVLQAQASIASASDQRALVFATLSVAAAALVFSTLKDNGNEVLAQGTAVFFCISAVFTTISAAPGRLFIAGSKAALLKSTIDSDTSYHSALYGLALNNDEYIDQNEHSAKWRAHCYRFSVALFLVGVSLTLFGFLAG